MKGVASAPKLIHTFDKKVIALSSNDIYLYPKYGVYNGQLGLPWKTEVSLYMGWKRRTSKNQDWLMM